MSESAPIGATAPRLLMPRVSLFAALMAAAALPLYIHLPRYAGATLGLDLSAVGALLIALRVVDFAQDPLLGRLADRAGDRRGALAGLALAGMAAGFVMTFALRPPAALAWLGAALLVTFTAYSLAAILFYAQGVRLAGGGAAGTDAHLSVAAWRESGMLTGVVLAAALPTAIAALAPGADRYRVFGLILAIASLVVWMLTRPVWQAGAGAVSAGGGDLPLSLLRDRRVQGLLALALVNALPLGVTSTLFLFFVEDHLAMGESAGAFLILFFVAAGAGAPLWARAAERAGAARVLLAAMVLAILAFIGAALLPAGAGLAFSVICVASGAALGADFVILPALFARVLGGRGLAPGFGFGLWNFAQKLALALAAAILLPALDAAAFTPGGENTAEAEALLVILYALVPVALKLGAIALLLRLGDVTS